MPFEMIAYVCCVCGRCITLFNEIFKLYIILCSFGEFGVKSTKEYNMMFLIHKIKLHNILLLNPVYYAMQQYCYALDGRRKVENIGVIWHDSSCHHFIIL